MNRKTDIRTYLTYTLSLGCFWACYSVTSGFAAPYLQNRGFTSSQLGIIMAIAYLLSLLLSLYLSARTDTAGESSSLDYLLGLLGMQLAAIALLFIDNVYIVALAYVLMGGSVFAGTALYVKLFVTLSKFTSMDGYGKSRAAGSLCYALTSFACGFILKSAPSYLLLLLNAFFALVQIIALISIRKNGVVPTGKASRENADRARRAADNRAELLPFLRRNPGFPMLLLGAGLIFMVHNSISTFTINMVEHLGGDVVDMGNINGFSIFIEIPFMTLYSRIDKKHCRHILMLSFAVFVFKICITAAAWSIPVLFVAFALRAVAFALYTPAVVDYISSRIPYEDSGKAQGLAANVPLLGTMVGSVLFGVMFDHCGVPVTLLAFCAAVILGAIAAFIGIRKR